MSNLSDLQVYSEALDIAEVVYSVTAKFPIDERFGLVSQSRRAAVSIAANISEGHGRMSKKEFAHFISIALGSASELETHLVIASRLGFLGSANLAELNSDLESIRRKLGKLYSYLRGNTHD